jgi:hypothetical protein
MTTCRRCIGQYRCNCARRQSPKVRAHLRQIAVHGALASAQVRRLKSWQRWQSMVKGLTVQEAWRAVYVQGYRAGYERRRRMEGA